MKHYGPQKIVLGIDARDGMVAIEGWVEESSLQALEFGEIMRKMGVETAIYTDISRDGLLQGPNLAAIEKMARTTKLKIIASRRHIHGPEYKGPKEYGEPGSMRRHRWQGTI